MRMPATVVFIHGAWLTPASWDRFRGRFEARGYETIAPPWPFNDRPIEELRRAPDPGLAQLTIGKLADHFEELVRALPEPPILVGHSFGGLLVQKLMDRGRGSVVVAIDPVPPRFVQPRLTQMSEEAEPFSRVRSLSRWSTVVGLTVEGQPISRGFRTMAELATVQTTN
jgi:pimeloyl-ACP methyl ester carboxylesterase